MLVDIEDYYRILKYCEKQKVMENFKLQTVELDKLFQELEVTFTFDIFEIFSSPL